MIRRPGHLADRTPPVGTPVPVEGLDLALAGRNVEAAGGSAERFAVSFAAGRAAGEGFDPIALAGIAGWRAGALGLRDDALGGIERAWSSGEGAAAAAALGMDAAHLGVFVERQRTDRYWWPGRREANGYVCAVGGFRGLGGAWTAPPADGRPLGVDGAFAVRTGARWWRIDADAWGSRLSPLDDEPDPGAAGAASVITFADSYLVWIHVAEPA